MMKEQSKVEKIRRQTDLKISEAIDKFMKNRYE